MVVVEFFGLPGSGKTTLAQGLVANQRAGGLRVRFRREQLWDDRPSLLRHGVRWLYLVVGLVSAPTRLMRLLVSIVRSQQATPAQALKVCWNLGCVLGWYRWWACFGKRSDLVVIDQGMIQAAWSVSLSGRQQTTEWWDLLRRDGWLPTLLVIVDCADQVAAERLAWRSGSASRLSGLAADHDLWQQGRRAFDDIALQAERSASQLLVQRIDNTGAMSMCQLVNQLAATIPPHPHSSRGIACEDSE